VILENACAFPEVRGFGYLAFVSRELLTQARQQGYKSAIGYIKKEKIASLNDFFGMGFKITKILREQKLLGKVMRNLN